MSRVMMPCPDCGETVANGQHSDTFCHLGRWSYPAFVTGGLTWPGRLRAALELSSEAGPEQIYAEVEKFRQALAAALAEVERLKGSPPVCTEPWVTRMPNPSTTWAIYQEDQGGWGWWSEITTQAHLGISDGVMGRDTNREPMPVLYEVLVDWTQKPGEVVMGRVVKILREVDVVALAAAQAEVARLERVQARLQKYADDGVSTEFKLAEMQDELAALQAEVERLQPIAHQQGSVLAEKIVAMKAELSALRAVRDAAAEVAASSVMPDPDGWSAVDAVKLGQMAAALAACPKETP